MKYKPQEFSDLIAEVERQSGSLLAEECIPTILVYKNKKTKKKERAKTCGCKNKSLLLSVYECDGEEQVKRGGGFAKVCAVCDNVGEWPRYENALAGEEGIVSSS